MIEDPLALMIRPLAVGELFATHWDRGAVHVRGELARFAELFDVGDWHARRGLGIVDAARVDDDGVQHQRRITADEIDTALASGETVCADVSSNVRGLQALRERWVPAPEPAFAKLYASPVGAGFAMHMDAHHVFVLQLEGRKRWTYSPRPVVAAPLFGGKIVEGRAVGTFPHDGVPIVGDDGRPLAPPSSDDLVTVELVPGDCLYLPPGSWHTTRALAPSIAISVSPPRAPALPFVLRMLEQQLARIPALRRDLVRSTNDTGPLALDVRRTIDATLAAIAELSGGVDRRLLHRAWALQAFAAERATPAVATTPAVVRRSDVLVHAGPFEWLVAPIDGGELVCLYQRGAEWTLPIDARGFIESLAHHRSFAAEDAMAWDRRLDWNGTRDFLAQLVAAGILVPAR